MEKAEVAASIVEALSNVEPVEVRHERAPLVNHHPRSTTTVHGKPAIIWGLVMIACGLLVVLPALDVIHVDDSSYHGSRKVVAAFGCLFLVPGLLFLRHGIAGMIRRRRFRAARERDPVDVWEHDFAWNREGHWLSGWKSAGRSLLTFLIFGGFMAPFHWFLLEKDEVFVLVVLGFFDLVIFCFLLHAFYLAIHALKYGRTYVTYDRFPFHTGERISVRFGITRSSHVFTTVTVTLRCVVDAYETQRTGKEERQVVRSYSLFSETRTMDALDALPAPGRDLPLEYDIPADLPGTRLNERPPTYWELEVVGDAPGVDYKGVFLLPVY